MERLRVGFIGAGPVADRHADALTFPDVHIAGIADSNLSRAEAFARRRGAQAFASIGGMLAALALDALWICVPAAEHGTPERVALAHGLPFFTEPPLSTNAALAIEIAGAVRETGLVTSVGYPWRHLDAVESARRLCAATPPRLIAGHAQLSSVVSIADDPGDLLPGETAMLVDLALLSAGDVAEVHGLASGHPEAVAPPMTVKTLRHVSGAVASLSGTGPLPGVARVGFAAVGNGLALRLTEHDLTDECDGRGAAPPTEKNPIRRQARAFLDAISGRDEGIRAPYDDALRTHLVTLAIARSIRTGASVLVSDL